MNHASHKAEPLANAVAILPNFVLGNPGVQGKKTVNAPWLDRDDTGMWRGFGIPGSQNRNPCCAFLARLRSKRIMMTA